MFAKDYKGMYLSIGSLKNGKMAKSEIFTSFFGHNSHNFQYFAKRIF